MEDTLKQILLELKTFKKEVKEDIKELKEGQNELSSRLNNVQDRVGNIENKIEHLTNEVFKTSVRLEDKIDKSLQGLDFKLDKIYVNTDSIAKQFTNTAKQELPTIRSRQIEHSNQLEDHEERISKLEAVE